MFDADQSISKIDKNSDEFGRQFVNYWCHLYPSVQILLRYCGLLPFQGKDQIIGNVYHCFVHGLAVICTVMWILKEKEEIDVFSNLMVESIFQLLTSIALLSAYVYIGRVKNKMMLMVAKMWDSYTDDMQNLILSLGGKGLYIGKMQALLLITTCTSYACFPVVIPFFMTLTSSGNQTFQKALPLHHECLIDEDKYFYIIFAYQFIALSDFGILAGAVNMMYCALLISVVAGIRSLQHFLKKIDAEYSHKISMNDENANEWICVQLKDFIRYHQILTNFYEYARGVCRPIMFGLLLGSGCGIILAASSMVIAMETDMAATARMFIGTTMAIAAVIFICFPSQVMKNASDDIFLTCCMLKYQSYPPKTRKILLFIIMKTAKSFALTAGPLVELNFETCRSIIKSSFSYTAAFRSLYNSQ